MKKTKVSAINILGAIAFAVFAVGVIVQGIFNVVELFLGTNDGYEFIRYWNINGQMRGFLDVVFSVLEALWTCLLPLSLCLIMLIQAIKKKQIKALSAVIIGWQAIWTFAIILVNCVQFLLSAIDLISIFSQGYYNTNFVFLIIANWIVQLLVIIIPPALTGLAYAIISITLLAQNGKKNKKLGYIRILPLILMLLSLTASAILLFVGYVPALIFGNGIEMQSLLSSLMQNVFIFLINTVIVTVPSVIAFEFFCCSMYKFQRVRNEELSAAVQIEEVETALDEQAAEQ